MPKAKERTTAVLLCKAIFLLDFIWPDLLMQCNWYQWAFRMQIKYLARIQAEKEHLTGNVYATTAKQQQFEF